MNPKSPARKRLPDTKIKIVDTFSKHRKTRKHSFIPPTIAYTHHERQPSLSRSIHLSSLLPTEKVSAKFPSEILYTENSGLRAKQKSF